MPTSLASPYPPNCHYSNNKREFASAAAWKSCNCGAVEMNGYGDRYGQQFCKLNNDIPQANGFLSDHTLYGMPGETDAPFDLIVGNGLQGIPSSLEANDFDSNKHSVSYMGCGSTICNDNTLFSPLLGNTNGNNMSYGSDPFRSKIVSSQPWEDSQSIKSTFQGITGPDHEVSTLQVIA